MEKIDKFRNADDWEAKYLENSTRWEREKINPALVYWLKEGHLLPGKILIPGCGRSPEPFLLTDQGFDVTGLDFAPSAIKHQNQIKSARADANKISFEQVDVLSWQAPAMFDAIYEQTCLCAIHPDQTVAYAEQMHSWLRPGGLLFALFMQTDKQDGPPFHCGLEQMSVLFSTDKWQWLEYGNFTSEHNNDKVELGRILRRI
ncbi:MAG: methyltransferase domain-containing protein [Robiginitomaculum sp.]|nr:methyltransferase domain-containing protein [Robiginitomaculum sp.]